MRAGLPMPPTPSSSRRERTGSSADWPRPALRPRPDMSRSTILAAVLGLAAAAAVARAQSLGEVAAREQEKKAKKPPSGARVYTDEDLKKARESGSGAVTVLPAVAGVGTASREDVDGAGGTARDKEKYWRAKAAERRDGVGKADAKVQELESRVSALRVDINPGVNVQDPNRLQTLDRALREAQDALEAARREAATARQALADLEDEARRAGALPGWVREP